MTMPPQSRSVSPASIRTPENDIRRPYKPQKTQSGVSNRSGNAPSSVYLASAPLTRDLSDLSGSYANGNAPIGAKGLSVPGHIYDQASFKGPWQHSYVLSATAPTVAANMDSKTADAMIFVENNDIEVVELLEKSGENGIPLFADQNHRIPVVLVLMNPDKKGYELMQLWVDKSMDSVRDVVHTLQQKIPDPWKTAYDGVFQMRGNKFSQLIHILKLEKYDVRPHEIWIAKPWSMTSKMT
jgi:hypothetical protein